MTGAALRGVLSTHPNHQPFIVVAIAICLFSALANFLYHQRVFDRMDLVEHHMTKALEEKMMTTKWVSGGQERSWTTTKGDNETPTQCANRHKAELQNVQQVFPVDP